MTDNEEDVGYGRPPRHSRFRKGRSGNPGGRPTTVSNKTFVDLIDDAFARWIWVTKEGKRQRKTVLEVIMQQLVDASAKGDDRALELYMALDTSAKRRGEKPEMIIEIIPGE